MELRVYGPSLDPDVITRDTGLQPCRTQRAGTRLGSKTLGQSMWGFDGALGDQWESLEQGLNALLDLVEPQRGAFERYAKQYSIIWWCGHFQRSFDGGPTLSVKLLNRLAEFPADLFIDNYFSSSDHSRT